MHLPFLSLTLGGTGEEHIKLLLLFLVNVHVLMKVIIYISVRHHFLVVHIF